MSTATATPAAVPSEQRSPRVIHWTRTAAATVLGISAIGVMWPALGAATLWIVPILALTAAVAGGAIAFQRGRTQLLFSWLWLVWAPIAFILAGLPVSTLNPLNLRATFSEMTQSLTFGLRDAGMAGDAWMLAGWLVLCGLVWSIAASQACRANRGGQAVAFFLFAVPFAAPLALGRTEDAAWQGGALLIAGLLWATRGNLRDGLPALAVVAVVGVALAALVAPTERWSGLDRAGGAPPPTAKYSSEELDFGRPNRTTGATMFEIRAERASLWRAEAYEQFDGRTWSGSVYDAGSELPQPGARRTTSTVRVDGISSEIAFAPGRIVSVGSLDFAGSSRRPGTEAVALTPMPKPKSGQSYTVVSDEVPISAALEPVPIPRGKQYQPLTAVFPSNDFPNPAVGNIPESMVGTPYGRVVSLAGQLSAGATTELEVVNNVQNYFRGGGFKYSQDVAQPGQFPLIDFLLDTRVGYCQHFAGAAALLLRMAGIPTRVAVGWATGVANGEGQWTVRDEDGHAWIEVYFPGHGWVAFDPTPPQSPASVAEGVATTEKPRPKSPEGTKLPVAAVLLALGLAAAAFLLIRRLRRPYRAPEALGDVLARLVPAPAGPSMTFDELRLDLRALGPAVVALADEAELQRFGPDPREPARHPQRRVRRALLADVGLLRTLRIVILGPGRRPIVDGGGPKITSSAPPPSVAPPGTSPG